MSAITFPYTIFRGIACPIIPLEIKSPIGWIKMEAYVDSGAFLSIFSVKEAQALEFDYQTVKESFIMVGDGSYIPVHSHKLPVRIGNIVLQATIGFSPRLGVGFNLLGRKDVFDRFLVTFNDPAKTVSFLPFCK